MVLAGSAFTGCVTDEQPIETSEYGQHVLKDATNGGIPGFYFLAPLGDATAPFPGLFDGALKSRLSVSIHHVDCAQQGTVGSVVQTYSNVLVYQANELYRVNHVVSSLYADGQCYRVIPRLDGAPLGFSDVQVLKSTTAAPAAGYRKWGTGANKPILFRLENMDPDGDGIASPSDNCVLVSNADQIDTDGDLLGDACDPPDDVDGDGAPDTTDNCITTPNADQVDTDGDGTGDACDSPCPDLPATVGHWRADGTPGSAVGSGIDGVVSGTVGYVPGRFGQAFSFTGAGFVRADGFDRAGAFTLSFWARADQAQAVNFGLVSSVQSKQPTSSTFQVDWNATKGYRFKMGGQVAPNASINIGPASLTQFQHIVVTYDGASAVAVYLDGAPTGAMTWTGPQLEFSSLKIGTNRAENYPYRGAIDNLEVFDRALTQAEVAALHGRPDVCVQPATPAVCGDGHIDAGEQCDDSNIVVGDGCGSSCQTERCGDGLVQFSLEEQCDDGNTAAGDGCDATCQAEPFVTTPPVQISGSLQGCTTAVANAARKLAVDSSGSIYAVMTCSGVATAVVTTDRGESFSTPRDLSSDLPNSGAGVAQVAIGSGPSGVAYVAIMQGSGDVYFRSTHDSGATWSAGLLLGTSFSTSIGLSLESFNDDVFVGFYGASGIEVARNHHRGVGAFESTTVQMSVVFFDLMYDVVSGTLVVAADTPDFHVRASTDGGVTFAAEVNPPGAQYYSDWAIANGNVFTSGIDLMPGFGNSTLLYIIPTSNLATSTSVGGLPAVTTAQTRTVSADSAGNAYVMSQLDGGGVQLDRLDAGASALQTPRTISATGGSPISAPLPGGQGVAVLYTDSDAAIWATIQKYE